MQTRVAVGGRRWIISISIAQSSIYRLFVALSPGFFSFYLDAFSLLENIPLSLSCWL